MARQKSFYNPDELLFDSGQRASATNLRGAGLNVAGRMQARQRNPFARSMGPGWDGYFGLMQAKENAANAAGKNFNVEMEDWGNNAVKPTTIFDIDQTPSSLNGIYNTAGLTGREMLPPSAPPKRRTGRG